MLPVPAGSSKAPVLVLAFVLFVFLIGSSIGYYLTSTSTDSIVLFIVGLFVFTFSFLNKIWAIYFLVFAMMFSPEFQIAQVASSRPVTARAEDFLILIIMTGWLANIAVDRNRVLFRRSEMNLPIIVYIQIMLISTLLGIVFGNVEFYSGIFYMVKYIEYFMVFFFVLNTQLSVRQVHILVYVHLLTSFVLGIYGMSQVGSEARVSSPFEGTSEPATMGGYLALSLSITLAYCIHYRGVMRKFLFLCLSGLLFVPLLYTLSRASFIAFIAAYLVLLLLSIRKPMVLFLMFVGCIVVPFAMPATIENRMAYTFQGDERYGGFDVGGVVLEESTAVRVRGYIRVLEKIKEAPVFGFGITGGGFIDGQYFRVLAETGVAGLTLFLWIQFLILRYVWRLIQTLKSEFARPLAIGFLAGHVGLLMHATGSSTFIIIRVMEPFWFLLALLHHFEEQDDAIAAEEQAGLAARGIFPPSGSTLRPPTPPLMQPGHPVVGPFTLRRKP